VLLVPSAGYPFPAHVKVLRGIVVSVTGEPRVDALVTDGSVDRATTDADGLFALALRVAPVNVPVPVTATYPRAGTSGTVNVTLPADLGRSHTIVA
jgi:hypothetical protein